MKRYKIFALAGFPVPPRTLILVVIPRLQKIYPRVADQINNSMFLGQSSRPRAGGQIFERLWFADAGERFAHNSLDQIESAKGDTPLSFDPKAQVFAKFRVEHGLTIFSFAFQLPSPPASLQVFQVFRFAPGRGGELLAAAVHFLASAAGGPFRSDSRVRPH